MAFTHQNLFLIVIYAACLVTFATADYEFDVDGYEQAHAHTNVHARYQGNVRHGYGFPISHASGTWYGAPNGAGSDGGACGLGDAVQNAPYNGMIAAGNPSIFKQGKGCGECYQVRCTRFPFCSGNPVTVTITDECPGCNDAPFHFDLSGTAFGAMARPGQADSLRNVGQLDIQFRRVWCNYGATKIAFKTQPGSNPSWFATAIEFEDRDGDLQSVEIAAAGTRNFVQMSHTWGATWAANINPSFGAPFSFRLVSQSGKMVEAWNAVPAGFVPGQTYSSNVNF